MNRKQLETIVLIVGVLVIGMGLFFMLTRDDNPGNVFVTNIIFAIGFLIYIIYSIMNTSSLQKEIRALQSHVDGLKTELKNKDSKIDEQNKQLQKLKNDNADLKKNLDKAQKESESLQKELKEAQNNAE